VDRYDFLRRCRECQEVGCGSAQAGAGGGGQEGALGEGGCVYTNR
jgi:uncharacterized UBP type Zn finger protein